MIACGAGLRLLLLMALSAWLGCQPARRPESFIPADAAAVLAVPRIDQLVVAYHTLGERLSEVRAVQALLGHAEDVLRRETGVELDRPESFRLTGLNPQQGLYAFVPAAADRGCVVAAVQNQQVADRALRLVLSKLSPQPLSFRRVYHRGLAVTEVVREGQTVASAGFVLHRKVALLCAAEAIGNLAEYIATIALSPPSAGLWQRPELAAARRSLGSPQAWLYLEVEAAARWLSSAKNERVRALWAKRGEELAGRSAFATGLEVSPRAATLRFTLHSSAARAAEDRRLASGQGPPPNFLQFLPSRGPIVLAKASLNLPATLDRARQEDARLADPGQLDRALAQVNDKLGLDLPKDALSLLSGRFLLGFDKLGFGLQEVRHTDDLTVLLPKLPAYLLLQVKQPGQVAGLLSSIERRLRQLGVPLEVSGRSEPVFTLSYRGRPTLSYGLRGDVLLVSTAEHFAKLLGQAADPWAPHADLAGHPRAASLSTADDQLLYLDLIQTAAFLHALALLRPNPQLDEALLILDRLRDLSVFADWQDEFSLVEVKLRMR